ncbi:hypothetical protein C8R41DRAFT_812401 [Lentinula lateritia]|uniref:Uncharacterized protein n=1 Tax=Lentinula lateritia TaxID=40482 RepID=A0ABQ8VU32_9AGAR|nr:hypothetical protein C8R41DRAFT_812401 [Lentinula lateritia]
MVLENSFQNLFISYYPENHSSLSCYKLTQVRLPLHGGWLNGRGAHRLTTLWVSAKYVIEDESEKG